MKKWATFAITDVRYNRSETRIIKLKEEFRNKKALFLNMVNVNLKITKIPKKVEKFPDLDFNEFLQIIKRETKENLQLKEIDEWEYYFKSYQKDLVKLKCN